ncbi:MAG: type II toxin-antitoxin system HicA family toxin [Proteobacteria bacterium]|nr:type II toxin-antitoxin system HicA family toxin [Pseudomonadota bacterium]
MESERNSQKIIKRLKKDNCILVQVKSGHHLFQHPDVAGTLTVPHPVKDLPDFVVRNIYAMARWR